MEYIPEKLNMLPEYMREGVDLYVRRGRPPGGFLTAIITSDLRLAVGKAYPTNQSLIPTYVEFFHNYAPAPCWGSADRMREWVERGGIEGIAREKEAETCV